MVEKFGSDQQQIATLGGGVISEDGATLLSGESLGQSALLFGPAALREIKAGVANGDFAIAPADDTATITADNPLPYWTFTDVNSAGAITAALVADAGAASGNVLRFTVASGTLTGKSATLSRFIPVASSASRSFSFYAEATFENGTNSTQANAKITCEFYKSDQATVTGTAFESDLYTFNLLQVPTGATAPDFYVGTPDLAETTAPADAAFLKITITIATVATQSADRTVDLTEVRVGSGLPELILTDKSGGGWPAYIINNNDTLSLYSSSQSGVLDLGDATNLSGLTSVDIYSGDLMNITTGNTGLYIDSGNAVDITAPSGVNINNASFGDGVIHARTIESDSTTTSDLILQATGSDVYIQDVNVANGTNPRILFRDKDDTFYAGLKSGAPNIVQVLNGSSGTDYAYLYAERFYPMDGSTASRYLYDDGTNTATSSNLFVGNFPTTAAAANLRSSSAAGSQLLISTSSRRWKENIEDTDAATLQAAKRLKPRHFNSLHAVDNHKRLLGMIAEEVEEAGLECAVEYDAEGLPLALDWAALTTALLVRLEDAERRISELESR